MNEQIDPFQTFFGMFFLMQAQIIMKKNPNTASTAVRENKVPITWLAAKILSIFGGG